jgi:hypothetical protein
VKGYERILKDIGKAWEPKKRNAPKESPKKERQQEDIYQGYNRIIQWIYQKDILYGYTTWICLDM